MRAAMSTAMAQLGTLPLYESGTRLEAAKRFATLWMRAKPFALPKPAVQSCCTGAAACSRRAAMEVVAIVYLLHVHSL